MMARASLRLEDAISGTCRMSGKPVSRDSLTLYKDAMVGFCNPGCRDTFEKAVLHFEAALVRQANHG